ncbi:FtsQ-type POTRA domain-containing protein [Candidatus Parcubacteria bacterium]|nr:FtsQ-type POTRA domain-containing protein [Candidatus Parcubacteria bacterium]
MKVKKFRKLHRIKRKKSLLKNKFFWFGVLILAIVVSLSYFLFFHSFFQIKNIEIFGNEKLKTEQIESLIEKDKNIFLFNIDKNKKKILENFPEITELLLEKDFPRSIKIQIEERKPVAIFCQNEKYFFIDKKGIVYEKAEANSMLKIKNLTLNKELELRLGDEILTENQLNQIIYIETKLKENLEIQIELAEIVSDQRLNIKTSEGWEIYFNIQEDIDWQLIELGLILKQKISPEKRGEIKYIDLRFEKVFIQYNR